MNQLLQLRYWQQVPRYQKGLVLLRMVQQKVPKVLKFSVTALELLIGTCACAALVSASVSASAAPRAEDRIWDMGYMETKAPLRDLCVSAVKPKYSSRMRAAIRIGLRVTRNALLATLFPLFEFRFPLLRWIIDRAPAWYFGSTL
ncbi:MAG: hypothetical protein EB101_10120 [Chitinophagia bacterium]|nr:hypothetical protein [Chitinophagia bacterium]